MFSGDPAQSVFTEEVLQDVATSDADGLKELCEQLEYSKPVLRLYKSDDLSVFGVDVSSKLPADDVGTELAKLLARETRKVVATTQIGELEQWRHSVLLFRRETQDDNTVLAGEAELYTLNGDPGSMTYTPHQRQTVPADALNLIDSDNTVAVGVVTPKTQNSQFDVRICNFRLWLGTQDVSFYAANSLKVLGSSPELLFVQSLFGEIVPENESTTDLLRFEEPQEPSPPEVTPIERIVLLIGENIVVTLRNNLKDVGFDYEHRPYTNAMTYRLALHQNMGGAEVHVDSTAPYVTGAYGDESTVNLYDRFLPVSRGYFNKLEPDTQMVAKTLVDYVEKWNGNRYGLPESWRVMGGDNVKINEAHITDVANQCNWSILDVGNEIFLVRLTNGDHLIESAEKRVRFRKVPTTSNDADNVNKYDVVYDRDFALESYKDDNITLDFTRINTFAAAELRARLYAGIDSLLPLDKDSATQLEPSFDEFDQRMKDHRVVVKEASSDIFEGANALYYEEIFFHIPLLIATRLSATGQFAEAQKWFHYIFNPTVASSNTNSNTTSIADRYWMYTPFQGQRLYNVVELLANEKALNAYRSDPFDPHAIAALRINAYKKAVVMKYVRNIIAWADGLFSQDTREAINEATQLYVLASTLLGPTPKSKPARDTASVGTFEQIRTALADAQTLPDFVTEFEPDTSANADTPKIPFDAHSSVLTSFGVPENGELLALWGTVDDRLFKIRHSLNINGVFRSLALFQPPIDPRALVAAAAGGGPGGFASALPSARAVVPHYRLSDTLEKAKDMVDCVIEWGALLYDVLESRDDSALAALQQAQEKSILKMVSDVKALEVEAARKNLEALRASKATKQQRRDKLTEWSDQRILGTEVGWFVVRALSAVSSAAAGVSYTVSGISSAVPEFESGAEGAGGTPKVTVEVTEKTLFGWADGLKDVMETEAKIEDAKADVLEKFAEIRVRKREWQQERAQVENELKEIELEIDGAETEVQAAQSEELIHQQELRNSEAITTFMKSRFHNSRLRTWLGNRASALYFQAHKITLDIAKQAERAYQFEFASNATYIAPSYWDSGRKGLLAGEKMKLDLMRLEKAAHDEDSRFMEITKNISLATIDPAAFMELLETGRCQFSLSHLLFDLDFPGNWFRVIKTLAVSIQVDLGDAAEFDGVHAMLTQTGHKTLLAPDFGGVQYLYGTAEQNPGSVRVDWRANQQIAISTAREDSGLFKLQLAEDRYPPFADERYLLSGDGHYLLFDDERYLPFENTGCVSNWTLELPKDTNRFDFARIKDVTLHLRYSCNADNGAFREQVRNSDQFKSASTSGTRMVSLAHAYPQWSAEAAAAAPDGQAREIRVPLDAGFLPANITYGDNSFTVMLVEVRESGKNDESSRGETAVVELTDGSAANASLVLTRLNPGAQNYLVWIFYTADS